MPDEDPEGPAGKSKAPLSFIGVALGLTPWCLALAGAPFILAGLATCLGSEASALVKPFLTAVGISAAPAGLPASAAGLALKRTKDSRFFALTGLIMSLLALIILVPFVLRHGKFFFQPFEW